ncbi:class I adenylate-forming enzyme family protein [Actinocrispum wychmicini]|uniref:Acyl-CoA synthetase (AMP-forming)/AMP-acid ligase II n=1 Tax=Actinocrispum wychmicini TaxID=1213861 RepID=A0A4R2JKK2_9PSEU|nr:class I adenylate-forming enzyme family protein [Actinocrispum wychmicini]TCO60531.1 acyl-CoA synthetase (AMP-forming)/AMP-acid ligase II [Actinocrispum wychmicini]
MPDLLRTVLDHGEQTPHAVALIDAHGRQISYGTLTQRVKATAGGLRANGFMPGDSLLFSIRPGLDALVLALATVAAGGTIVFIDPGVGTELFSARAELAGARWSAAESLLYAAGGLRPARAYVRRRGLLLPDLSALPVRHIYSGRWLPGVPRGARPLRKIVGPSLPDEPDPDAPAVVIFTSGTTARPRAVVHTLRSLSAGLGMLRQRCALEPGDIVHTDQLMLGLPALAGGACWSLPGTPLDPARFVDQMRQRHVTHAFLVPGDAARVLDVTPKWPDLRGVLLGAAPVVPALLRRIQAAAPGAEVLSIYGMTEAAPLAFATAEEKLAHPGPGDLLGTPPDGVRITVVDDELVVQAPHVCPHYLGEPSLTKLHTGDLGRIDDGRVIMLGRRKDMLIRGEHNIYPGLYEPMVTAIPGVREALLVGIPDEQTGDEEVVLAVVLEPDASLSPVKRRLPEVIPPSAFPDRVVAIAEVPRSGRSRKPDREALRCALR